MKLFAKQRQTCSLVQKASDSTAPTISRRSDQMLSWRIRDRVTSDADTASSVSAQQP